MITAFRRYLDSWIVRAFFVVMILAFVFWGVGDVVRMAGHSTWVAKVGGQTIEAPAMQMEYQRAMATATRNLPAGQEASPELRRRVGHETLQRMVGQAALSAELRDLRIVTPDAAVAEMARSMPAFHGPDGKFSKQVFDTVLRNNGLTEARFLDMLRGDLAQRQLMSAVTAGAFAPAALVDPIYRGEFEKRSVTMVEFPIAAAPEPAAPDDAALQRYYDNHPDRYKTPEFRRIRAITLTTQKIGQDITVTDDELRDAFERTRAQYAVIAKRSAEVISTPDEAKAKALAEKWRAGADWATMQKAAEADGATALSLDDATETQFPDPDLGKAVFAQAPETVGEPVKAALGWFVIRVTKATVGENPTFEQVKDRVRERLITEKAADRMYDFANKVDNLLANGTPLNDMPGDLGLSGLAGTLDAEGMTQEGNPAPIPGPTELRAAVIAATFATQPGDQPRLTEVATPSVGGSAYYALSVEDVIPAALKPFDTVKEQVADDWKADQQRHEQETAAAKLLTAVQGGQSLADAAAVAGVTTQVTPLMSRSEPAEGVVPEIQRTAFSLKKGEATMVETPEGFAVLTLADIVEPDAKADAKAFEQARAAITRSIGSDLSNTFVEAVRQRANPQINQTNLDQIVQP
ncbi:MAG: SurA N-terminal domain-containing protein [Acetobacteraceae bacterium]